MNNESKIIELLHQKIKLLEVPDYIIDALWCKEMKEINDAVAGSTKTAPENHRKVNPNEKVNPWAQIEAELNTKGPSDKTTNTLSLKTKK